MVKDVKGQRSSGVKNIFLFVLFFQGRYFVGKKRKASANSKEIGLIFPSSHKKTEEANLSHKSYYTTMILYLKEREGRKHATGSRYV